MLRAIAFCALVLAVHLASAQSVTPRILADPSNEPEPALGISNTVSADERKEHDFAPPSTEGADLKPVDKHALLRQKLAEMNCLQSEIDQLRIATGTPQQILVKVKAIEVSRTKAKALGIDCSALRGEKRVESPRAYSPPKQHGTSTLEFDTLDDADPVLALFERLQAANGAKVIAEPNIVVTSGRPAQFHVGGEVPMPKTPGSNQAVEFKQFGTEIDVLANAHGNDRVRLEVRASVSEVDTSKKTTIDGVSVPGFSIRQVDSAIELQLGQTGVFSGMIQERTERIVRGDKVEDQVNEIELYFLVTPELHSSTKVVKSSSSTDAAAYRTATSASEERPNERSLRVTRPNSTR
jgi:Bacterial type II and III secretion system protein